MEVEKTNINNLYLIKPKVFGDDRGYFFESFNQKEFNKINNIDCVFVQDNQSKSDAGVLRGLHFQQEPFSQGKLVRVVSGSVLDVVVDIRPDSDTFGHHYSVVLDTIEHKMLWIPPGMAHGFLSLENSTIFSYKCTNYYQPSAEKCILWSDEDLNINWGVSQPILSSKDKEGMSFKEFKTSL